MWSHTSFCKGTAPKRRRASSRLTSCWREQNPIPEVRAIIRPAQEARAKESGGFAGDEPVGKGFFDGNPFALDIAGTFSSDLAREFFAESDLVIGAGLGHFTTEGGYL